MRLALLLVLISLLFCCGKVLATEGTYRVSGIVGQENRWVFAVIEDSTGSCRVYRKGDLLGNWLITDVTPQGVLVDAAGDTRLLRLEGNSFVAAVENVGSEKEITHPFIAATRPMQGKLSKEEFQIAVNSIAADLERNKQKTLEPEVLNAILGFSSQTVITAVNEKPVKNAKETVNILQTALKGNLPVDFTISEGDELSKIYFRFSEPTALHPHE